jgi:hypothetical protein
VSGGPAEPVLFLVTGAPRSGTTFVGDWLNEDPATYCVHEVWDAGEEIAPADFLVRLQECAATGSDRLGKEAQREFIQWPAHRPRPALRRLGLKEPVTWTVAAPDLPRPLDEVFAGAPLVVTVRHPYDVVASGLARAANTSNWPGFSVAEHCDFWIRSVELGDAARAAGRPALTVVWEEMLVEPERAQRGLEQLLGLTLPPFDGFELTPRRLADLRRQVDRRAGLPASPARELLPAGDRARIAELVAGHCDALGYAL